MCNRTLLLFKSGLVFLITLVSGLTASTTVVKMKTSLGDIYIELYDDKAPVTVKNFTDYVKAGFYDGLIFHRVINNFMAQTGAYDPNLYSADFTQTSFNTQNTVFYHTPNAAIKLEITAGLKNLRGTVAMARTSSQDSATSQFFFNVKNNAHLDRNTSSPYAVFGVVTQGMDIVDAIVKSRVDNGNFTAAAKYFEDLPKVPVKILEAKIYRQFTSASADFSSFNYLKAKGDMTRLFRGQGALTGKVLRQTFTAVDRMTPAVQCLQWQQTVVGDTDMDTFTMALAKDAASTTWITYYIRNQGTPSEQVLVNASSAMTAVPLSDYADESLYYRLLLGLTDSSNVNDPDNTITTGSGASLYTEKVEQFNASLPPDPNTNLALFKKIHGPLDAPTDVDWSYYHKDKGLVLELFDDARNTATGDGWRLNAPVSLTNVRISFTADVRRTNYTPRDSFACTGPLTASQVDMTAGYVFVRVGSWEQTINTSDPDYKQTSGPVFTWKRTAADGGVVQLVFDLKKHTFKIYVKNVNLTEMAAPVAVEIVAGAFSASGTATVLGGKSVPLRYLYGKTDKLLDDGYKRVYDDGPRDDVLTIWGQISANEGAIDMTNKTLTVKWNSKSYTVSSGKFKKTGKYDAYVYKDSANTLYYFWVDWNKAEFKLIIKLASVAGPTKDLQLTIKNSSSTVLYDQTLSVKAR